MHWMTWRAILAWPLCVAAAWHDVPQKPSSAADVEVGSEVRFSDLLQPRQGLTLVHCSGQRKHILWDTLGA
jgi:hypothetical protein